MPESGQDSSTPIHRKKPQELAAQLVDIRGTNIQANKHPLGKTLDEAYARGRERVQGLLESGVSDEVLAAELKQLYEQGIESGIYAPGKSRHSSEFYESAKRYYMDMLGCDEENAIRMAKKGVGYTGYLNEVQIWRSSYEHNVRDLLRKPILEHPLTADEESRRIIELRNKCIYIGKAGTTAEIQEDFPNGVFLYHGTPAEQAINILLSGELLNVKTIWEREQEKASLENREVVEPKHNSGYEGISWNYNAISAMPGDRYHLVGFVATPQDVLLEGTQLIVPSKPAPNELLLISQTIDTNKYYEMKTQQILYLGLSIGENNSVSSNIIHASSHNAESRSGTEKENQSPDSSMLVDFVSTIQTDEQMATLLRSKYTVRGNGTIDLSITLQDQPKNEIPVAAVWLQALIDTGRIRNIAGFETVVSVREIVQTIGNDNYNLLLEEMDKDYSYPAKIVEEEEEKAGKVSVPVSQTYFVVPDNDLNKWLRVIARCNATPRGIIVYRHNEVRLENFATLHRGDNAGMYSELRTVIPATEGGIMYEEILGEIIRPEIISGYRKHVIGEQYLGKRKSLRKDPEGNLIVL